jgi:hypothetical protein
MSSFSTQSAEAPKTQGRFAKRKFSKLTSDHWMIGRPH